MRREKAQKIVKEKRRRRVRAKIFGFKEKPRLSVFRSNKHFYLQLIDDSAGRTLCFLSDSMLPARKNKRHILVSEARELGRILAEKAQKAGIKKIVFDRGLYKYHGRIKALAEGAREGGLEF